MMTQHALPFVFFKGAPLVENGPETGHGTMYVVYIHALYDSLIVGIFIDPNKDPR